MVLSEFFTLQNEPRYKAVIGCFVICFMVLNALFCFYIVKFSNKMLLLHMYCGFSSFELYNYFIFG